MNRIGIIIGSNRVNRKGEEVAAWVHDLASRRGDGEYQLVDLRDYPLPPQMDEPPAMRPAEGSAHPQIRSWADKVESCDGFVFVTPEYNHSVPGVLKTAIDYLYAEWNNKAAGFVSYGVAGGARAAEHLRSVCGALQMADVGQQVTLSLHADFENFTTFVPAAHSVTAVNALLDHVVAWTSALAPLRAAGTSV